MFKPDEPRLFILPPGVDFGAEVVRGLADRLPHDPAAMARVHILVNTRRMQRRLRDVFAAGPARLLPKIALIQEVGALFLSTPQPPAVNSLRRRLSLTALVQRLLEEDPDLAPEQSLFALTDSLAALLDEMNGEGVGPEALEQLDVSDQSGHWERTLRFVRIAYDYTRALDDGLDPEARQRETVTALIQQWEQEPPVHPMIIAGSTGSRGTTRLLMEAVAHLPQGALIMPGADMHMPASVWSHLEDSLHAQDHPQYRLADMARSLGLTPVDLPRWTETPPPNEARNALVSLALRPAPVTDQWLAEGPALQGIAEAAEQITLVEAPSPRIEAEAVALGLRQAAADGKVAALITPDRILTRQVSAALDRWAITGDDSAGLPLHLTAVGRLLRHAAEWPVRRIEAEQLLVLLKQPLTNRSDVRNQHLLLTRELELHLRRFGPPYPTPESMAEWALERSNDDKAWAEWISALLTPPAEGKRPLVEWVTDHIAFAEALNRGQGDAVTLWDGDAGEEARKVMGELVDHAEAGIPMTAVDYAALVTRLLQGGEVRRPDGSHPGILIWGTLEARVQSAEVLILAGLNEGVWPEAPDPDPWLNRQMRIGAGLLIPDRRIGLAAHDFQQAAAGKEVWFTRALRTDEAETIPARWLNRLTNLLAGLDQGRPALDAMRQRGAQWVTEAEALERPKDRIPPALRPSPRPPVEVRPKVLSVTDVPRLLRDPYAIYARDVLKLHAVPPLVMSPDARIKGTAVHTVMERFTARVPDPLAPDARAQLLAIADEVMAEVCPWPVAHRLWMGQLSRNAGAILDAEAQRRNRSIEVTEEASGGVAIPGVDMRLKGRADRIDLNDDGEALLYDYKTGAPPSKARQLVLDKQLLIEAAMVEEGAFGKVGPVPVKAAWYVQIGAQIKEVPAPLTDQSPKEVWDGLIHLFSCWEDRAQGYTAQMAAQTRTFGGDYDHLARYGEWTISDPAHGEDVE